MAQSLSRKLAKWQTTSLFIKEDIERKLMDGGLPSHIPLEEGLKLLLPLDLTITATHTTEVLWLKDG
jgi:hypothetical protein